MDVLDDFEQVGVISAKVEDWRYPFERADDTYSLTRFRDGNIDWPTFGQ